MQRNCAMAPRQLLMAYGGLCAASLLVAIFFWVMGAVLVLPFAALELVALGVAFLWYARHATDQETIHLGPDRLVVEWEHGGAVQRQELAREWLRVEAGRSLVSLRGQGLQVEVGRYLRPAHRYLLAQELRLALGTV